MTPDPITLDRVEPTAVLSAADRAELQEVLVLGWTPGGRLYAASSTGEAGEVLHMVEKFKHQLMTEKFDE